MMNIIKLNFLELLTIFYFITSKVLFIFVDNFFLNHNWSYKFATLLTL